MLGRKIIQIECCDSTNNYIANLLSDGKIEYGTVILSDEQTRGKGQRGASWLSNPGENLLFSLYLDTANLSVKHQFILTQYVSISVCHSLEKYGLNPSIKWPNDILINGKKIAGILIENQLQGNSIVGSIVGIGLNINQLEFSGLNATSLKLETGSFVSIQDFVFSLINELKSFWKIVESENFELIEKYYFSYLWLLNKEAVFVDEAGDFIGTIRGVEKNGLLIIERNDQIIRYDLKEIKFPTILL